MSLAYYLACIPLVVLVGYFVSQLAKDSLLREIMTGAILFASAIVASVFLFVWGVGNLIR